MKNKKGLVIGGLLALAGLVGGGIYMGTKAKNEVEVDTNENDEVENNESDNEE